MLRKQAVANISQQQVQRIFTAHQLGSVRTLVTPVHGAINLVIVVNNQYVLRVDYRSQAHEITRLVGEKRAYDRLADSPLPIPQVIVLDTSRSLLAYDYMIMTRLHGATIVDAWPSLSVQQREAVAFRAGQHLAQMHHVTLPYVGGLNSPRQAHFTTIYDHAADFCERFSQQARAVGALTDPLHAQVYALLEQCRPWMSLSQGHLLHSDYHFENLLVDEGTVSGIIDFEWAFAGDPTWDFLVDDQWEAQCSGSRAAVYAGYTSLRPLDAQHELKLRLYKALHYIETMAGSHDHRQRAIEKLSQIVASS